MTVHLSRRRYRADGNLGLRGVGLRRRDAELLIETFQLDVLVENALSDRYRSPRLAGVNNFFTVFNQFSYFCFCRATVW
jgi:hypothetical protein